LNVTDTKLEVLIQKKEKSSLQITKIIIFRWFYHTIEERGQSEIVR